MEVQSACDEDMDAKDDVLRNLAKELRDFITNDYPRDSLAHYNWPDVKPLIDKADKILGDLSPDVATPNGNDEKTKI